MANRIVTGDDARGIDTTGDDPFAVPTWAPTRPVTMSLLALVLLCAVATYLPALGSVPYFGGDEAYFASHAHAIATTGRDASGSRLPLFFTISDPLIPDSRSGIWYQPFLVYLIAAILSVVPITESSVRLAAVVIGIADIALIYLIARQLFSSAWFAALTASFLVFTPAHFIFSRQALDYLCPVPFILGWMYCVIRFARRESATWLFTAGLCLGFGVYSYVAAWLLMPIFWVATCALLAVWSRGVKAGVLAISLGFGLPLVAAVPWLWWHPEVVPAILGRYHIEESANLVARLTVYWNYFNPSYLFINGGSNPTQSTRTAGVFPLAMIALLTAGVIRLWREREPMSWLLLIGFFAAPLPIVMAMPDAPSYNTGRALAVLPFGVLLSACGLAAMLRHPRRSTRVAAALLAIAIPAQFGCFLADYHGGYAVSSAARFDPTNVRSLHETVVRLDSRSPAPVVYLGDNLDDAGARWRFYCLERGREDLWRRTRLFSQASPAGTPAGSLLVISPDTNVADLVGWALADEVVDARGSRSALILRRLN